MSSSPNCEEKFMNMASSSTGYYYSDDVSPTNPNNIQTHLVNSIHNNNNNQIQQSFEFNKKPVEIYNSTAGMEMIEFPPKYLQQSDHQSSSAIWKGVLRGGGGGKPNNHPRPHHFSGPLPSSSKTINDSHEFYYHQQNGFSISDTDSAAAWHEKRLQMVVDDPSLRCVFRCEGNERPSHGLSLSLSATNPSTISLQSFELRRQDDDKLRFPPHTSSSRDGLLGKSIDIQQYQQMVQDDHWLLGKDANLQYYRGQLVQIRNSQYLGPAQELLNEFCSLVAKQIEHNKPKTKAWKTSQQCLGDSASSSSSKQPLHSLELLELQKRIAKLFQMLDEVDKGYKHYCDKMKVVVSSFEEVAGNGAATVYSLLASKAMSKHFRCLRDGITDQIKSIKKAMGEKDSAAAPGASLGETPRLRILDQTLRQQKSFQQINMLESHPWRPQRGLPERSVSILRAWLFEHFLHPYPTDVDKHILARQTGLSRSQVSNWFINARVRLWKPMVEEMYLEETKEEEQQENNMHMSSTDEPTATATSALLHYDDHGINGGTHNKHQNQNTRRQIDQKPTAEQLILRRINDSESLSSIVNNNPEKNKQHSSTIGGLDSFGAPVDLDFSTYNIHHHPHTAGGDGVGIGGGSAVSLTLGLQQNGGNGLSLAFSPTSQQASLFYHRDQMEDCQSIQYSIVDGEGQSLPYRNLMGAQLLRDFAG